MDYYLELCDKPIRFDPVSQNVNVFFDESKKQVFSVRAGNITIKHADNPKLVMNFPMDNPRPDASKIIIAIKFNQDNSFLAMHRGECIELHMFANSLIVPNSKIVYEAKRTTIYGFIWTQNMEIVIVTSDGLEMFQIIPGKKTLKSIKSIQISSKWFSHHGNFALLSSNDELFLTPVLLKAGSMNKLNRIELEAGSRVQERDVTLGVLYGVPAILVLKPTKNRSLEIVVYLLNGVGLAPKKSHILRVGYSGRVAINIIDNVIVVHHQTTATSLLFDIALNGEVDSQNKEIMLHSPLMPGRTIKPFKLKIPALTLKESTISCDLYSPNWVLFQPDVVIDAKLGCLWNLELILSPITKIIAERVKLVEFLLQRNRNSKEILLAVLKDMLTNDEENVLHLPILEVIFNKLNKLYKDKLDIDIQNQTALPPSTFGRDKEPGPKKEPPIVMIDQADMNEIFANMSNDSMLGKVLLIYVCSLIKNSISCECDLSKTMVLNLTQSHNLQTLQQILSYAILNESKPLACFLLSLSKVDPVISQMSLDMLKRLNANDIIIEILLEQGKVVDAIKLAKQYTDHLPARKYLEAALKAKSDILFYTIFTFFQQRNIKLRGTPDFLKTEHCDDFVNHFQKLYDSNKVY